MYSFLAYGIPPPVVTSARPVTLSSSSSSPSLSVYVEKRRCTLRSIAPSIVVIVAASLVDVAWLRLRRRNGGVARYYIPYRHSSLPSLRWSKSWKTGPRGISVNEDEDTAGGKRGNLTRNVGRSLAD